METSKNQMKALFVEMFDKQPEIKEITGGGSSRVYYRLIADETSVIGVWSDDIKENNCFISLDKCFHRHGVRVPEILAVSNDERYYLLQDLGDTSLLDLLSSQDKISLSENAIDRLTEIQTIPAGEWSELVINKPFSERLVRWDLNYFKYNFLKAAGVPFDEDLLEDDFERLCMELMNKSCLIDGFMYRDFQSRNIMVKEGRLYFIDFQGGRKGPGVYDLVSFLWQAKAPFTEEERNYLSERYFRKMAEIKNINIDILRNSLSPMVLFRTLQVLGAYGLRGLTERKKHFLESIPKGVANLCGLKKQEKLSNYPEISRISDILEEKFLNIPEISPQGLTVTVLSFSYKKGYPDDNSGNGGGFMFDCRGLHNPGRYTEYKTLTGRDRPVIEFLSARKDTEVFIENAMKMVAPSVDSYLARNFNSLQVGFGCTGGQHRSVFCAEEFSKKLKKVYGEKIRVKIIHREQYHERFI